jgi:GTP pyrophosphokinase
MSSLNEITNAVLKYHPKADVDVILRAYLYSAKAHRGQSRHSGEAYFSHPLHVALNLTRLKMDEQTIAAGLLHDTLEDTLATADELKALFGEEIYQLVDGVTKIGQVEFESREEKQAENYRKMILAMARDIRVIMIKLADRAHNMQTLDSMSDEQRRRIATETLDIYAPVANRLGIGWLKTELENGSFKHLHPDSCRDIEEKVSLGEEQRQSYVEQVIDVLMKEMQSAGLPGRILGRPKHFYSIFTKMRDQNIRFDDVYDLIGLRVITDSVKNCYALLGLAHSLWKPIPGKFKDYIAMPKPNLYQSLHTTVIGPEGHRVEVQIRTEEMHLVADEGIAAHWQYKEGGSGHPKLKDEPLVWLRRMIESHKDLQNPREFINALKVDLYPREVFVFTPRGEVVALPAGATPVDFAYQVHSDIGNHCGSAKVNGRIVPLRYKLRNGDRLEILTGKQKHPSRDWLAFVKTSKARNKIVAYINAAERAKSLSLGRELLEKEFLRFGLEPGAWIDEKNLEEAMRSAGCNNLDSLLRAIGYGKVSPGQVTAKFIPKDKLEPADRKPARVKLKEKDRPRAPESAIKVKCFDDEILLRLGKCCNPVQGDHIVGYITRGRGVSVHTQDCPSIAALGHETERMVEVEWDSGVKTVFNARVSIVTEDRPGLLASISRVLADCDINIRQANVRQGASQRAHFDLIIDIHNREHLERTLAEVEKVKGVIHVERVLEYNRKGGGKPGKGSSEASPPRKDSQELIRD